MILKAMNVCKIRKAMEKTLDNKRYEHTLGVAYTAASLAMCYDVAIKDAEIAGLLHDCAKCITNEKRVSICEKHNIPINEIERRNPFLLHAKVGSFFAMEEYNITNPDIINAILNHTTGRPGMSILEKIVFVADYIEPNRRQAPNLKEIRKMAFQDIDSALLIVLEDTLNYLNRIDQDIDPMTQKTYEYYKNLINEKR